MKAPPLVTHPAHPTELFLVLHEQAFRPDGLEYEYMTGRLRDRQGTQELGGRALTEEGERRARAMGRALRGVGISTVVTEGFCVTRETTRLMMEEAGLDRAAVEYLEDGRVGESDLSFLDPARFEELGSAEGEGNPNATLRVWLRECPDDFERIVRDHTALWNELVEPRAGGRLLLVLHVEGVLVLTALALGLPVREMQRLHVPRGCPVHVRLWPDADPTVSLHDEACWRSPPARPFGHY